VLGLYGIYNGLRSLFDPHSNMSGGARIWAIAQNAFGAVTSLTSLRSLVGSLRMVNTGAFARISQFIGGHATMVTLAIIGTIAYLAWQAARSGDAEASAFDPNADAPTRLGLPAPRVLMLAAGIGSLGIGFNFANSAPMVQTHAINSSALSGFRTQLQASLSGGQMPSELSGNIFITPGGNGQSGSAATYDRAVYFDADGHGGYMANMISLDPHGFFVGPLGPNTRRPFFKRNANGGIEVDPAAKNDLDKQLAAAGACASIRLSDRTRYAACLQAQGTGSYTEFVPW
jgi:hypothetical protein